MQARFRTNFLTVAPPWLQGYWGTRFRYTLLLMLDAFEQFAQTSTTARLPGLGDELPDGALAEIGKDRVMSRGAYESTASYSDRLVKSFDAWRRAGSAEGQMRQVQAFFLPENTPVRLVTQSSTGVASWYTILSLGSQCDVEFATPSNWDWDGNAAAWARTWLVIYPQPQVGGVGPRWGEQAIVGDGHIIGTGDWSVGFGAVPPEEVNALRAIVRLWKAAHTVCQVVVAFDVGAPVQWPKPDGSGPDYPNGTWGDYYDPVTFLPTRYLDACYLAPVA